MKRGSVWWVAFDPAQGTEIHKTRPAIIVSNDAANRYLSRVVVVPLTSNIKNVYPGEARVTVTFLTLRVRNTLTGSRAASGAPQEGKP
jgi:mRNA-degrading endonuclease toxin of MazEF toxin-antitoxin module